MMLQFKILGALLALAFAVTPLGAAAQGSNGETIHGTIVSLDGTGNLALRDDRGFIDSVRLEPNVEVTPAGVQLQPGMRVTIVGANAGSVFAGEQVAAEQPQAQRPQAQAPSYVNPPSDPYAYAYPAPYPVVAYPYPVYAYPYPVYVPYGPPFSIGIGFGPYGGFRGHGYRH